MTRDPVAPVQDTQFRDFVGVLKRRKVLVVSLVVAMVALGAATIPLTPTNMRSVSRILVETSVPGAVSQTATDPVGRMTLPNVTPDIGGHLGNLQSPDILGNAFQQAGVQPPSGADATEQAIAIKQEGTTSIIDITVNLPDADSAARVAQAIPVTYNEFLIKARETSASSAIALQRSKLTAAQAALQKSENDLERFRAESGEAVASASEGEERQGRLRTYDTQLELARTNLAGAQSRYDEAVKARSAVPREITNPNITSAVDRYAQQERAIATLVTQLKDLQVTFSEQSPQIRSVKAQLANEQAYLKKLPKVEIRTSRILNPELSVYSQRVTETQANLAGAQAEVSKLEPLVAKERAALNAYRRRVPQEQELLRTIGLNQAKVQTLTGNVESITNLSRPTQDPVKVLSISSPVKTSPQGPRTLALSGLLGLVLGVAAAMLRDRADNRVHTLDQIYDATGAMPLGQVSVSDKALALGTGRSRNAVLESYRTLRFNLESSSDTGTVQSVLVASASAGEGRAGLSHNLALEAATDERRTILVDGDMRTPELHGRLKIERGPGLSDVLAGRATLDEALVETSTPNLMFLPAGTEVANPLELLASTTLEEIHTALKAQADVVVINSPSLLRFSDGRALARVADSVLYVAKRGFTKRDAMRYCVETLRRAHAHLLGVVLSEEGVRVTETPFIAAD